MHSLEFPKNYPIITIFDDNVPLRQVINHHFSALISELNCFPQNNKTRNAIDAFASLHREYLEVLEDFEALGKIKKTDSENENPKFNSIY